MGSGCTYICKHCGYELETWDGIGMMFPEVYRETIYNIKNGKYGEEARQFFVDHPDGAVNCANVIAYCETCKTYEMVMDMGLYVPKEVAEHDYVTPWDLKGNYEKVSEIKQVCPDCGKRIRLIRTFESKIRRRKIPCPKCGEPLERDMESMVFFD